MVLDRKRLQNRKIERPISGLVWVPLQVVSLDNQPCLCPEKFFTLLIDICCYQEPVGQIGCKLRNVTHRWYLLQQHTFPESPCHIYLQTGYITALIKDSPFLTFNCSFLCLALFPLLCPINLCHIEMLWHCVVWLDISCHPNISMLVLTYSPWIISALVMIPK